MAANQVGKTLAGSFEMAFHLTGRYPSWWNGRRFDTAIRAVVGSESAELARKGAQRLLIGSPEDESTWGTGSIPKNDLVRCFRRMGTPNTLDSVVVNHVSGDTSVLQFSSYEQGRAKWQADTLHVVWFDEEPPEEIYFEGITRTNATKGYVFITFTPMLGMSRVVSRFYPLPQYNRCAFIQMDINDAEHFSEEQRKLITDKYPAHERDARARGIPKLGSGAVFPVEEEYIKVKPFEIPSHFCQIIGIDFGWDHPSAAVRLCWDKDNDIIYVTATHRARENTPTMFAPAVKAWGDWIKVAWPHDGLQHRQDKNSSTRLAHLYKDAGLNMMSERATFEDGSDGVEAGIMEMLDRMETGRLKVFSNLSDWFSEFRTYHRKDGLIVKENDDLMAATRYGIMMKRFASTKIKKQQKVFDEQIGWMG